MITVDRDRFAHLLAQGAELGPYDELPLIPAHIDPQITLSRNDRPQPSYLIFERDSLLGTMTGRGHLELRTATVQRFDLEPGDYVYVPKRTPHRIVPHEPMIQFRCKAQPAGLEAAVWYCDACGAELWRYEFDADVEIPQAAWWSALESFNADEPRRTCAGCGAVAPVVSTDGLRWTEMADAIAADAADE